MGNKDKQELTTKQQRFVDLYDGNALQAAEKAGYLSPGPQGNRLLKNGKIAAAIREREAKEINPGIKSRKERQEFWTTMMSDAEKDSDRLKASELLGRSEADFTDNVKHDAAGNLIKTVVSVLENRASGKPSD